MLGPVDGVDRVEHHGGGLHVYDGLYGAVYGPVPNATKRRRTSGFKARMATKSGQNIIKARRARGRAELCPASTRKSGGKK
ncbi:50S ribosomal protein L34 [Tetrabaena socialis]|uniref:50S ribosomal protein L34 n=1 Tax=Tetrabaena socialis TaxID=47790 RepID=A0A2J8ADP2_9CHLO|nr:50S ribosomal protein L34 [Tetrabaena socialis]|eukprot:PNH10640.1 50S ribosomal protein L34 [Tetrabaena socialis]